ncbi:MAG: glycosyltransferase family 2 protein [Sphingobacteriales bacterium]|nr:MAG: glycosyltransferase family 2 protein [Sphingobacteriales bacterium]
MPEVSIIIPVYNTEKYIGKAIESVLIQKFTDFELILVDDASTDNTYSICKEYAIKDKRIQLYKNEKNLGMMPNWNQALKYITGKYWAKLDADDWWEENFIQDCYNIISNQDNIGMVCGRYIYIDENDNIIPNTEYQLPNEFKNKSTDFIWRVKQGNGLFNPALAQQGNGLIRTEIIQKFGTYTLLPAGDTEFYFRIGAHYNIYFLDKLYHYHRIWSQNFTRTQVIFSGKAEKNLYDVKQAIFDYYYKNKKINMEEYSLFIKENNYEYNKTKIAIFRKEMNYKQFLKSLSENFIQFPFKTIIFYLSRIFNK